MFYLFDLSATFGRLVSGMAMGWAGLGLGVVLACNIISISTSSFHAWIEDLVDLRWLHELSIKNY